MMLRTGTELINPFRVLERAGIRERMRVADFGCGALGHFVFPAAQMAGAKGIVYAVDILQDALRILERRAKEDQYMNIDYVWSDFDVYRATHIPEGSLDLILFVNNLFLSQNRQHLVKEMARLLKKGGKVLVVDWKPTSTNIGPPADRRLSPKEVKDLFDIPEFDIADEFEAGKAHYALVFKRTDARLKPPA